MASISLSPSSLVGCPKDWNPFFDPWILKLKRKSYAASQHKMALETTQLLRLFIHQHKGPRVSTIIAQVKELGRCVSKILPYELSICNIIRRVLRIIKEEINEYLTAEKGRSSVSPVPLSAADLSAAAATDASADRPKTPSTTFLDCGMYNLAASQSSDPAVVSFHSASLVAADLEAVEPLFFFVKTQIIQAINDFIDDIETINSSIAAQSFEHIHSNEIIMTYGYSNAPEEFLLNAARKRPFHVIVAESSPKFGGQKMAVALAAAGIETTLIPDSAVFALISRVNKVILGCDGVLANGGLLASCGCLLVACAAKHYSTPVVVLAGIYKLSSVYAYNLEKLNLLNSPQSVMPFCQDSEDVEIVSPAFDYIPPEMVSIFVTNVGVHSPSYIYRLLGECYCEEDFIL